MSHPFAQLFLARLREFYREPEAIFWVYGFPVLLAVGLGIAFASGKADSAHVDIQKTDDAKEAEALLTHLRDAGLTVELHDADECRERLRTARTSLYVIPEPDKYQYVYDERRAEGREARFQVDDLVQRWKAAERAWPTTDQHIDEVGSRYIDFLIPGLIGMNLMGGGLFGIGFGLVDMRVRKLLKRLVATPMRRSHFLLSILVARLVFLIPEMLVLLAVGTLGFGVPIRGGLFPLIVIILVASAAFSGIGLLVACRTDKTETVSGFINLVMLPMWILSGVFFSSKRFPDVAQPFIQALPLTQANDALRATMLEGAALPSLLFPLAILAAYAVVTYTLALRWFRWQ
jgi:ABC-type multidrug transport system permease subunit